MIHFCRLLFVAVATLGLGIRGGAQEAGAAFTMEEGTTEGGAKFALAVPAKWSGNLLIYCHGFRAEEAPVRADLLPLKAAYAELVAKGWIVAMTSYRRNGIIIDEALDDVRALRAEVVRRHGHARRVILHGESMGGAIAVLLMERDPAQFSGALAVSAAVSGGDKGPVAEVTFRPGGPVLFLTNRDEAAGPASYAEKAQFGRYRPITLVAARDGHVNVNQAEVAEALRRLNDWISTDNGLLPGELTRPPAPRPEGAQVATDGRSARPALIEVTPNYGNLFLDLQPAELARLGVQRGGKFRLSVPPSADGEAEGAPVLVTLGATYGDVGRGEWVAFFDAEDRLLVAINRGSAAKALGLPFDVRDTRLLIEPAGK